MKTSQHETSKNKTQCHENVHENIALQVGKRRFLMRASCFRKEKIMLHFLENIEFSIDKLSTILLNF